MLNYTAQQRIWENFNIWLCPANLLVLEAFQFSIKIFLVAKFDLKEGGGEVEEGREEGFN